MPCIDRVINAHLKQFFSNICLETGLVSNDWCIGIIKPLKQVSLDNPVPLTTLIRYFYHCLFGFICLSGI